MAITKSAKKAIRASAKKRLFNLRRKGAVDTAKKNVLKLAREGKTVEAQAALKDFYKAIDKAAKTKYLKKNTVSRLKSRISKFVNKPTVSKK